MGRNGTGREEHERTLPVDDTGPDGNLEKKALKLQDTPSWPAARPGPLHSMLTWTLC